MKKNMVIIVLASTALLQGMDNKKMTDLVVHGVNVQIVRDAIINADKQADALVVGRFSQERLQPMPNYENYMHDQPIGSIIISNELYSKHADDGCVLDNEKVDYYFAAFSFQKQNRLREKAIKQTMTSKVLQIAEPRVREIMYLDEDKGKIVAGPWYYELRKDMRDQCLLWQIDKKGDVALEMALEDLAACYSTILSLGVKTYKSIAIEELGTDVGLLSKEAAEVVAKTIIDFLKNSKRNGEYMLEKIILYMRRESAYMRYVELFKNAL